MSGGRRLPLLLLAVVLAVGSLIRLVGLERAPLRDDELNHYYVASALQRGEAPALPSGEWYLRGIEYSHAVRFSLDHVQPVERAVRLPSALLGCVALILFAGIAWSMAGAWAAVFSTLLLALYPEMIYQSRSGRFYTMQLLSGLIAFFAGWRVLTGSLHADRDVVNIARQWGWSALAIGGLALAARIQVTTLSVSLAWGIAVAAVAFVDLRRWGRAAVRWSVPLQLTVLGLLGATALLITRPDILTQVGVRAVSVPYWAESLASDPGFYGMVIALNLPLLVIGGAASLYYVARQQRALGLYLVLWFGVPFVLHSLLPWRGHRFIVLALPALVLAVGIAAERLLSVLHARVAAVLTQRRFHPSAAAFAANIATTVVALVAVVPTPALSRAFFPLGAGEVIGWRESLAIADSVREQEPVPLGHTRSLPARHYWGRLDFTANEGLRQQWLTADRKRSELGTAEPGGYVWLPMGSADMYTGAPVLTTPEAIRAFYRGAGSVLIGLDSRSPTRNGVRSELAHVLGAEATELCQGRCGPMMLYHWRFADDDVPEEEVAG
jgi:hypothetical protein